MGAVNNCTLGTSGQNGHPLRGLSTLSTSAPPLGPDIQWTMSTMSTLSTLLRCPMGPSPFMESIRRPVIAEAKRRRPREWKNTFRVGVYTCEMTYSPGKALKAGWRPDLPKHLSPQDWDEYRAGRDALVAEVATALDMHTLVVELAG
jgi:hypothetical protein